MHITSPQNPKIKNLVKLRRRRHRDRQRRMLIDGGRALRLALQNNVPLETLYFVPEQADAGVLALARRQNVPLQPVSPAVFQKIGYGDNPDGLLGVAPQPPLRLQDLPAPPRRPLYLIAEGLEKPGNIGAILRSADAAGASALILCDCRTDVYNPNVIHASRGAFFTVPVAVATAADALLWLRERNVPIFAAAPDADATPFTRAVLRPPVAIAVGAEHRGLTEVWLRHPRLRIPMFGQVDSLNVAQAAPLLLFEAVRQREATP